MLPYLYAFISGKVYFGYLGIYLGLNKVFKKLLDRQGCYFQSKNEPQHEISNNVVCGTSKASDQPAHMHSLIRALAGPSNIL